MFNFRSTRNYIRDISIVIVGIVITFAGSELINRRVKQKEVKRVMELIKEEIVNNINKIEEIDRKIKKENRFYFYLINNDENVRGIPLDTFYYYGNALGNIDYYRCKDDAFELLKNASLMQYVKNKELLLRISEVYDDFKENEIEINFYYDYKNRVLTESSESLTKEDYKKIWEGSDLYRFYEGILEDVKVYSFISTVSLNFFEPALLDSREDMDEVMALINKEYGFREKKVFDDNK